MRVTRNIFLVYDALKGRGWRSMAQIAEVAGVPRQNLNYAVDALVEAGIVEQITTTRPAHFRILTSPPDHVRALMEQVESTADIYKQKA